MNLTGLLNICEKYVSKAADTTMMVPTVTIGNRDGHIRLRFVVGNDGKVYFVLDLNERDCDNKTFDVIENYSDITRDLRNFKKTVTCDYDYVECVMDITDKWGTKRFPVKNIKFSINTTDTGESVTNISFA